MARFLHGNLPGAFGFSTRLGCVRFDSKGGTMSKKKEEEFRQLTDQALSLALSLAKKNKARGMPPPPFVQAMQHTVAAFRFTALALSEIFKSKPGRMPAP
jgi:hypothetical protein